MNAQQRARAGHAVGDRIAEMAATTTTIARAAGISPKTLGALIRGQRGPTDAVQSQIEAVLRWRDAELARRAVHTDSDAPLTQHSDAELPAELLRRLEVQNRTENRVSASTATAETCANAQTFSVDEVKKIRRDADDGGYEDALSLQGEQPTPKRLFALPMAPMPRPLPDPRSNHGDNTTLWGYCKAFCCIDGPTDGQTVDRHGPFCVSEPIGFGRIQGLDLDGQPATFYTDLVAEYHQGTYAGQVRLSDKRTFVRARIAASGINPDPKDGETRAIHLEPHIARSFAAELLRGADLAEGLGRDLLSAQRGREEDR